MDKQKPSPRDMPQKGGQSSQSGQQAKSGQQGMNMPPPSKGTPQPHTGNK
jgi:hypothetical protein